MAGQLTADRSIPQLAIQNKNTCRARSSKKKTPALKSTANFASRNAESRALWSTQN